MRSYADWKHQSIPLRAAIDARELALARGRVALARGDFAAATTELRKGADALPARLPLIATPGQHVPTWYALGEALLGAVRPTDAAAQFERIATSGHEHARQRVLFVRSFNRLGRIDEEAGDTSRASAAHRRFVSYWKDGDVDRDRVEEAQRKLAALR